MKTINDFLFGGYKKEPLSEEETKDLLNIVKSLETFSSKGDDKVAENTYREYAVVYQDRDALLIKCIGYEYDFNKALGVAYSFLNKIIEEEFSLDDVTISALYDLTDDAGYGMDLVSIEGITFSNRVCILFHDKKNKSIHD